MENWFSFIKCPYRLFFGISCPGCGMTRAWLSALMLDFEAAWYYHPLFWLVPIVVLLIIFREKINVKVYHGILFFCIALMIVVYAYRMLDVKCDVVVFEPTEGMIFKVISRIGRELRCFVQAVAAN